jgi:hypothetical protein
MSQRLSLNQKRSSHSKKSLDSRFCNLIAIKTSGGDDATQTMGDNIKANVWCKLVLFDYRNNKRCKQIGVC